MAAASVKRLSLEIYALAVCFAAVVALVTALSVGTYGALKLGLPEFTMNSWVYALHQSNETYWNSCVGCFGQSEERKRPRPEARELTQEREQSFARAIESERRDGSQMVTIAAIVSLLVLGVFALHWRLARRVRERAA